MNILSAFLAWRERRRAERELITAERARNALMRQMRTADIVYHEPSEEEWVVAWADPETGYMAPCGWPTCQARVEDCRIVAPATDEQSAALVKILSTSGRTDAGRAAEIAGRHALTGNGSGE